MNLRNNFGFLFIVLVFLNSCKDTETSIEMPSNDGVGLIDSAEVDHMDTAAIVSDYDMSEVDSKNVVEFKENLVKIEKEFGEQWDFCKCVVKGDSINKAFMNPDLPDADFDALSNRFDEIDEKCKAFRIQNPSATPEERATHEKKVKKCLKEAGL